MDKSVENSGAAMSLVKDKSLTTREAIVDALIDAFDVLAARVDGLEAVMDDFLSVLDRPLSPIESLEELRRLKEAIDAQG